MTRRVLLVTHPEVLGMELLGARDVLEGANRWARQVGRPPVYRVELASVDGSPVRLCFGLELGPVCALSRWRSQLDTLIVVGGPAAPAAADDAALVAAVQRVAARSRRVVGLCTGAFILAAAGLLDGRRCTTHWAYGDDLAARFPAVRVDTGPIFIRDGEVWTSAGIASVFDMLLAMVEADAGSGPARMVARMLVLFLRRTGAQAQFSVQLLAQLADDHPLRELQQFMADKPDADLSLAALAGRVHMSPRHFARVFRTETGVSPGRYVERLRLETARRRLEESDELTDGVAAACGFGNSQALRRAFVGSLGVTPSEYRRRFGMDTANRPLATRAGGVAP